MISVTHPDDKKQVELEHLDSFRHACGDFPTGGIVPAETPDFIVEAEGRRIGIELVRVYVEDAAKRSSLQSREAVKTRVTRLAQTAFEQMGLPRLYVDLFFNNARFPRRTEEEGIARAIAEIVAENIPATGEHRQVQYKLGARQPIEVDLISIYHDVFFGIDRWTWRDAGEVKTNAIGCFQAAIDKKSRKLAECLARCDECWLLVVAPSWTPAGMIHPDRASLEHTYISPFSETYFLNHSYGTAFRLTTVPAP